MLREDFMHDYGLTVSGLADALGVSRQTVNELVRERRAVSPTMALRLARLFATSAEFWLNAQQAVDLWDAEQASGSEIGRNRGPRETPTNTRAADNVPSSVSRRLERVLYSWGSLRRMDPATRL